MPQSRLLRVLTLAIWAAALSASAIHADASTFTTLYQFAGGSDGSQPQSSVIEDASGTLYGATLAGGTKNCVTKVGNPTFSGCGTVYSFNRSTGLKSLVVFNGSNGAFGYSSPTLIGSTLYLSAYAGGVTDNGVLFSIHTDGTAFKVIHQFTGADGSLPVGSLRVGPGHILYGVTQAGGPDFPGASYKSGVLFSITETGTYTVLHSFHNGVGGSVPNSIVVEKSGLIIGTTTGGGDTGPLCGSYGCGVLYSFNPSIAKFTLLHTFTNTADEGAYPVLGSVAPDGTVYGNSGIFFSIGPKGFAFKPASTFIGYGLGSDADQAPTLGPDGSLTSVQQFGSPFAGGGTLFQQVGTVSTVLYNFADPAGGEEPSAAPLLSPTGSFIGTAAVAGAACSCGTIWEFTP